MPEATPAPPASEGWGDLRVALVHDWLTGMRGGEKVLEAVAELFPDAPVYTLFHFPGSVSPELERRAIHTSYLQNRFTGRLLRRYYRHLLPLFPAAIEDFDLTGYDLVVSTSHCVAKGVIPGPDALHLCYCHSPMRYAWDQEHHYFPRRRGPLARIRNQLISGLRRWDVAASPRVDHFWANSSFVARRIRRYYGRDAEVLHPPVDVGAFADDGIDEEQNGVGNHGAGAYTLPGGEFALAVSALVPYKKLDLAIQACELAGMELLIVGTGPERPALEKLCRGKTRLLGRVDDRLLRRLFRRATLFVQPGIEDFGIASVEALAAGTPVVAQGRGGILDIVRDGVHGVLYEGSELDRLTAAIDKSSQIRFNPLELESRAAQFSADRFGQGLEASIRERLASREALAGHSGRSTAQRMERT